MKRYKPKNQTYAKAFKVLLSVSHFLIIEFKEGDRWHKVALDHGVMHWFEEVDEFSHLPKSAKEIEGRRWYLDYNGDVCMSINNTIDRNNVSTKERAEAFLALMQLVELRDAWNEGWKWETGEKSYGINFMYDCFTISHLYYTQQKLSFKSQELAEEFLETFRDLIETAKELI